MTEETFCDDHAAGEPCRLCPEGVYKERTVKKTIERLGLALFVKDVPALVWSTCGDMLLSPETSKHLEEFTRKASCQGACVMVRRYDGS